MEIYYSEAKNNPSSNSGKSNKELIGIALLIAFHFFGLLGMNWNWLEDMLISFSPFNSFVALTPFNLILTCTVLLFFHRDWNRQFVVFITSCLLVGFFIEVAGIKTGLIFGEYSYGSTLGWKVFDVPLTIGLNWLILTYSTGIVLSNLKISILQKAILLGMAMTAIDFLIEPVAIQLGFWNWFKGEIPVQNYFAWFIISCVLGYLFFKLSFTKKNPLAKWVLVCQSLFFLGQNIFLT